MKSMKRGLAVLLSALLLISNITVASANESDEPGIPVGAQQPAGENTSFDENYGELTVETPAETEGDETNTEQSEPEDKSEEAEEEVSDNIQTDSDEDLSDSDKDAADDDQIDNGEEDELNPEEDLNPNTTVTMSGSKKTMVRVNNPAVAEEVMFNTGNYSRKVVYADASVDGDETGYDYFDENGNYTIKITEEDPFFPYEVQFTTSQGEVSNRWFMDPGYSVEVGGHTFSVEAEFSGTAVTQMSLNVAGDTVIVYPEEKFSEIATVSLLPIPEDSFTADLRGYTPAELTMVSVSTIFGDRVADDTYDVVWKYSGDDYTISSSEDKLDLSMYTYSGGTSWEMIVGVADQLADDNTRYNVNVRTTRSQEWLIPTVYTQDGDNVRTDITALDKSNDYYDSSKDSRRMSIYGPSSILNVERQAYVSLAINNDVFGSPGFSTVKAYKGRFETAEDVTGTDITDQIFSQNMTEAGAGYLLPIYDSDQWITVVTYDADGNVNGCLPFYLYLVTFSDSSSGSSGGGSSYVELNWLYEKTDSGSVTDVTSSKPYTINNGSRDYTYKLYDRYPAKGNYYLTMTYYNKGVPSPSDVSGAFVGNYSSIKEAEAGASDIKDSLFKSIYDADGGYAADYSQRVYFTIFVGEDGTDGQEVYHCSIEIALRSGTDMTISRLKDGKGQYIDYYEIKSQNDSYVANKYKTLLVDDTVDLSTLALEFTLSGGATAYVDNKVINSGDPYNFTGSSEKAVQYRIVSEDGNNAVNYWVQIVKASEEGMLYINSFADEASEYEIVDGVQKAIREVMLDSYHGYKHDILLANMGTEPISNLSVELDEEAKKTLVLDDYWTLSGDYDLSGFDDEFKTTYRSELWNLAMIRLRPSESAGTSAAIDGTLTIKSGEKPLVVLILTGMVGYPDITTEQDDIIDAVKYVPYGTVIKDNNKYSWNKTSYSLISGELPEGMEVRPSGEIYGVPLETGETGEFTFTVRMTNSDTSHDFKDRERTYTLTVLDNTDENVENANDDSYGVEEYVKNITMTSAGEQTLVAEGELAEFQYLYLDGERLTRDVDFTAKSGSTRITISNQTLAKSPGRHTLGIEFRIDGDENKELRRAAQNYVVSNTQSGGGSNSGNDGGSDSGNGGSDSSGDSNSSDSDSGSNNTSTGASAVGNAGAGGNVGSRVVNAGNTGNGNAGFNAVGGMTEATVHTVEPGDTLWKIAQKYYGSGTYWTRIFADNADTISDPDKIYVGQKINIYPILSTATAVGTTGTYYTIESGDSLYKIAQKLYGKGRQWRKIYNANEDIIADPKRIYVGQVIFIPEE